MVNTYNQRNQYTPSPVAASGNSSKYPFLGLNMTYEHQRKCRMQDAIDDYLNDEEIDARRAYEDMLACVDDVINYLKKCMTSHFKLKSLLLEITEISSESEWKNGNHLSCSMLLVAGGRTKRAKIISDTTSCIRINRPVANRVIIRGNP